MMIINQSRLTDFTYKQWELICLLLSKTLSFNETLGELDFKPRQVFYLKHDVECAPHRALDLAKIAHKYNVRATFYFQFSVFISNLSVVRQISDLGHEIAYHYDVLDYAAGDYVLALKIFNEHINCFRSHGYMIKTICPHGNPLLQRNGWSSNKDFLRNPSIRLQLRQYFDVVMDWQQCFGHSYAYVSDAGYRWSVISDISGNDKYVSIDIELPSVLEFLKTNKPSVISTHPHRWRYFSFVQLFIRCRFFAIRAVAKYLWRFPFLKNFLSVFFAVAKMF